MRKLAQRIALTVAAGVAVVAGVIGVGSAVRDSVRERHLFLISEIECDPPAGLSREQFLSEVHYHGRLAERLSTLDSDTPDRLREGFARHPAVERVESVTITPPRQVRVSLVYRTPN